MKNQTNNRMMKVWRLLFTAAGLWTRLMDVALGAPSTTTTTKPTTPSTDDSTGFIPCSDPCQGGDVQYHLTASVRTMKLLNYTYRGRTYSQDGDPSFMGPTLRVQPGQSVWIKLTNNLTTSSTSSTTNEHDDLPFGPHETTVEDYWNMLQTPGENIKYQYYQRGVAAPDLMRVDAANIPHGFDRTNLHLHGLDVAVHMFDPVGTHDPDAPHVDLGPGECYCYQFQIPAHHPTGLYWYHPHLHGSTALQIWSGMLGLLYVEGGPLEQELQQYGITNTQEFVLWDPAFRNVDDAPDHNLEVDEFLMGQTTLSKIHPFLVNGQLTPNFETTVEQVLHLRALCGTIENENTFIVYRQGQESLPWDDVAIPFWVIASDGVTYRRPLRKNIIVMAGGQREEILLQFAEPGVYVISQQGIEGYQFFDMMGHPHSQILATITVHPPSSKTMSLRPTIPIDDMVFTPGYPDDETILAEDIVASETIVFSMGADRDKAPFPQYYVNGKAFAPNRLDFFAHPGEAREYILVNANHNAHPFHIHVNRFQVKEMGSELSSEKYPVLKAVLDYGDGTIWRDTVVVPPNGRTRIWVQYKNYTGKTVLHCHFLAHEDTGMMSTLFIGVPQPSLWHFLNEHVEGLLGLVCGIVLVAGTAWLVMFFWMNQHYYADVYGVVPMNELKSKVVD